MLSEMENRFNPEALANTATDALASVNETATNAYANVNTALSEFSSTSTLDASRSFLDSNSIIAKFAFIVLILIVFMFAARVGILLLGYIMTPTTSPYIIKGVLPGTTPVMITQNPKDKNSVTISRSNNAPLGIEFTWSVWLEINAHAPNVTYNNIFNKGNGQYGTNGIATVSNGPGLYVSSSNGYMDLLVRMDSTDTTEVGDTSVNNVPIGKWFNVIIRLENKILDIYINVKCDTII